MKRSQQSEKAALRRSFRLAVSALLITSPAAADTFGGFSGVSAPYLVDQDRVCEPLEVVDGRATGSPTCTRSPADEVAKLSFKSGIAQRGNSALFTASATSQELVVSTSGQVIVAWKTIDPIARVLDVFSSQSGDRVAVAFATRRLGKEVVDVIAFAVRRKSEGERIVDGPVIVPTPELSAPTPQTDPVVAKRIATARSASKRHALAAWRQVLERMPDHSEALYHSARLSVGTARSLDAIAALQRLARSPRADAIEWLVEARFDPAFSSVRADASYRAAVGLDRKPRTDYERLMGFGGRWEQVATCGEKPNVLLVTRRDRTFSLTVSVHCHGIRDHQSFAGVWRFDPQRSPEPEAGIVGGIDSSAPGTQNGARVVLALPAGRGATDKKDELLCVFRRIGDEEALHCALGQDLDFEVLPTRR